MDDNANGEKTASWSPYPVKGYGAVRLVTSRGRTIARVWATTMPDEPWFATWGRNGGGYFSSKYLAVVRCNYWAAKRWYSITGSSVGEP